MAGAAVVTAPTTARACGGTFCDAGPTSMPVEQTGETILFVLDGDRVQTHIQIEYDPDTEAARFAWIIPVPSLPEFSVGSQALFDALLGATTPSYGFDALRESCPDPAPDPCDDDGDMVVEKIDVGSTPDGGEPEVVARGLVGAFEVAVLDGGTAQGVFDWLTAEGFAPDEAATPILASYLERDFMFVALELATDAEASEVHPIVLEQASGEPCVPIVLTRIAAQDDLRLRTLFLADDRVVPDNYAHVVPNAVALDWLALGADYDAWITLAVDEAGGHGFVTEYAGPTAVAGTPSFVDPRWNADAFRDPDWRVAIAWYQQQFEGACELAGAPSCPVHPLARGLQERYLPTPEGVDRSAFLTCPLCFEDRFDVQAWDPEAFADAVQTRIVEPAVAAEALVATWPALTRMYTTLSPHEMTLDPTFVGNADAPEVAELRHLGTRLSYCDGRTAFQLPDGTAVATPGRVWPEIEGMPAASVIERWGPSGAPVTELDQRDAIAALLAQHNAASGTFPPIGPHCGDDGTGVPFFDGDASPGLRDDRSLGCGCSSARSPSHRWTAGLVLLLLASGLRRRGVIQPGGRVLMQRFACTADSRGRWRRLRARSIRA